jgi:hypothetical protein
MLEIKKNFDRDAVLKRRAAKFPLAASRALNEAMKQGRTFATKRVREIYNISRSELKKEFTIIRSNKDYLTARMIIEGSPIGIIRFKPTQTPEGVAFSIRLGNQKRLLHGFIQEMQSGHLGVFQRTGVYAIMKKGRYKGEIREQIKERFTLDLPSMMSSIDFQLEIHKFINDNLPRILDSKIKEF